MSLALDSASTQPGTDVPPEPVWTGPNRVDLAARWLVGGVGIAAVLVVLSDGSAFARSARTAVVVAAVLAAVRTPRLRAAILLAGSLAGIVLGLTFGVRYAAFGSTGWRMYVGWTALVAGASLLVIGVRDIGRTRSVVGRVTTRAAAVLALASILLIVTAPVMAVNVPPVADERRPDLVVSAELVHFGAVDGVMLAGWWVPPADGAVVILRHGAGRSTAAGVADHAEVLIAHGYGVLLTDARGHGRSEGRAMDFGWYGERDIDAAVTWLLDRPAVDPDRIAVLGLSMGGEEAIGAIGGDRRIAAVVADGATARVSADKVWVSDEYGWRGWVQRSIDRLSFELTELLSGAPRPDSLADAAGRAAPRPILLVAAGNEADESHAAAHIRASAGSHVTVWTVEGANHTEAVETDPEAWEARVVGFLDEAVRR